MSGNLHWTPEQLASYGLKRASVTRQAVSPVPVAKAPPGLKKQAKKPRVARTRNGGTQTEAAYWGSVRSCLRRAFRFWKPAQEALRRARVAKAGKHNAKWAFLCCDCQKLFRRAAVEIDHLVPCGALTSFEHVGDFLRRLTPESPDDYAIRCHSCHQKKTTKERNS